MTEGQWGTRWVQTTERVSHVVSAREVPYSGVNLNYITACDKAVGIPRTPAEEGQPLCQECMRYLAEIHPSPCPELFCYVCFWIRDQERKGVTDET